MYGIWGTRKTRTKVTHNPVPWLPRVLFDYASPRYSKACFTKNLEKHTFEAFFISNQPVYSLATKQPHSFTMGFRKNCDAPKKVAADSSGICSTNIKMPPGMGPNSMGLRWFHGDSLWVLYVGGIPGRLTVDFCKHILLYSHSSHRAFQQNYLGKSRCKWGRSFEWSNVTSSMWGVHG